MIIILTIITQKDDEYYCNINFLVSLKHASKYTLINSYMQCQILELYFYAD